VSVSTGVGPYIVGKSAEFRVLNVVPASATVTYQWYRGSVAIAGASGAVALDSNGSSAQYAGSYTTTTGDADHDLRVVVSASAAGYTAITASSSSVQIIRNSEIETTTMSGSPTVGSILALSAAGVVPSSGTVTYQWMRISGTDVTYLPGERRSLYAVTAADVGHNLQACAWVSQPGYATSIGTCSTTSATVTAPMSLASIGSVAFSDPIQNPIHVSTYVGNTGGVSVTGVTPSTAALSYQWYRGATATAIPGATEPTYTPTTTDAGHLLFVAVTASAAGYAPVTVTSQSTATVLHLASAGQPILTGSLTVGSVVSVSVPNPVPSNAVLLYTWYRMSGSAIEVIPGVTGSSYVVASSDVGWRLRVSIWVKADGYLPSSPVVLTNVAVT
jgi:hypothetical protein